MNDAGQLYIELAQAIRNHGEPPCTGQEDYFFAEDTPVAKFNPSTSYEIQIKVGIAKNICRACPVKTECLEYALSTHEYGVWAGTTQRERALIRKTRN